FHVFLPNFLLLNPPLFHEALPLLNYSFLQTSLVLLKLFLMMDNQYTFYLFHTHLGQINSIHTFLLLLLHSMYVLIKIVSSQIFLTPFHILSYIFDIPLYIYFLFALLILNPLHLYNLLDEL